MEEMIFFYPDGHQAHFEDGHPERPDRVETIRRSLEKAGWWSKYPHLEPRDLSNDFLETVHAPQYLQTLESACARGARLDMDTYTTSESWQLALNAAGGAVAVAQAVWTGQSARGIALTRPPGHHATFNRGMGFCLLNNVAIAAQNLISSEFKGHGSADRLAIIDLDLHHGNGTQDIFWRRGDVLYISTHQYPYYPGTGDLLETGAGAGERATANFPLPPFTGDRGFSAVMEELILPILDRFRPQMILVSFGFDPHWRDPLGHLMLSASGYGRLIRSLTAWAEDNCQGRIALFLEGGYDLDAGAACIQAVTAAMLGLDWQDELGQAPNPEGSSWQDTVLRAKEIWQV